VAYQRLFNEIIKLSLASTWETAKDEWKLDSMWTSDVLGECLCGHYPIREFCQIKNKHNQNTVIVGNCCVNKFIYRGSKRLAKALTRMAKDPHYSLPRLTIDWLYMNGIITGWECSFYFNVCSKRELSPQQKLKRYEINSNIAKWYETNALC